jgi:Sec-independent protein translocase protein TatA
MKRCAVLILLAVMTAVTFPAYAQKENRSIGENASEARQAAKQQKKYLKMAARQQRKAMKKTQKAQRKAAKQQRRRHT